MKQFQSTLVILLISSIGSLVFAVPLPVAAPASGKTLQEKLKGETFNIRANNAWSYISVNSNGLLVVPEKSESSNRGAFQICDDTHICLVNQNQQQEKVGLDQLHNVIIANKGAKTYYDFKPLRIEEKLEGTDLLYLRMDQHYVKVEETNDGEQYRMSTNDDRYLFQVKFISQQ